MKPPFSLIPLLPVSFGLTSGILIGRMENSTVPIIFITVSLLLSLLLWKKKEWWLLQSTVALIVGIVLLSSSNSYLSTPINGVWEGELLAVSQYESFSELLVDINKQIISGKKISIKNIRVRLYSTDDIDYDYYKRGDIVRFSALLDTLTSVIDIPYQISEKSRYSSKGISAKAYLSKNDSIYLVRSEGISNILNILKNNCRYKILRSNLSSDCKEFVIAVLIGDKSILSYDDIDNFSKSGLSHILALSGLHIGIIALIISSFLWPFGFIGIKGKILKIIVCVFLWGYTVMTGMSPSVMRAVLMTTILIISSILSKNYNSYNALLLAWVVLLLINPYFLFDIGFLLSFGSVGTILLFASHLSPFQSCKGTFRYFGQILGVSLAAVLGTGFLSASFFHIFPLLFIVANLLAAPLLPFVIGGSLLLLFFLNIGYSAVWLCELINYSYLIIERITSGIASSSFSYIDNVFLPIWLGLLWLLVIMLWKIWITKRKRIWLISSVILTFYFIVFVLIDLYPDRNNDPRIYILRDCEYATVMINNNNRAEIVTSSPERYHNELTKSIRNRTKEFFYRKRIDPVIRKGISQISSGKINAVIIDDCRKVRKMKGRVTHAYIGHKFTGTLDDLLDSVNIDTIIISQRFPRKRLDKLTKDCEKRGIFCVSLREYPFSIKLK